mgnify:CR=1 FL=1
MPRRSSLARLQRVLVLVLAAGVVGWFAWHWPASPVLALGAPAAIWVGLALVLGAEFLALSRVGRADPAPRPTAWQLIRAWFASTCLNAVVFGWWQPFRWNAIPDQLPASPGAPRRRGVVLIHGFVCNRGVWTPWLRLLRNQGVPFIAVNLEPAFGSIDDYPPIIEDAVQRITNATGSPPLLVCHSMGGVVVRAWLRTPGAARRVHHVVTIGSPHRGTWNGRFSRVINGRQLRLGNEWIEELGRAIPAGAGARFTCWYSNCDNMVFPVSTATLPGADNRLVLGAGHLALAYRPEVIARTLALLDG